MAVRNTSYQAKPFIHKVTDRIAGSSTQQLFVGSILFLALLAFEIFNFDTTRFALSNLLGPEEFAGITWAAILAVAFCAIDFAGLSRMFTPQTGPDEPAAVWYLTGAWFLGATMNAVMTWWAVSLTLLSHPLGNEVLGREQLLRYVPIFVAVLVWITRILFIGSIAVAGDHLLNGARRNRSSSSSTGKSKNQYQNRTARAAPKTRARQTAGAGFSSQRKESTSFSAGSTSKMAPVRAVAPVKRPGIGSPSQASFGAQSGYSDQSSSRLRRRTGTGTGMNRPRTVMQARSKN